jgi:hypothetical protein
LRGLKMPKLSKGQAITADFMFAAIIIVIISGIAVSAWNRSLYMFRMNNERTEMERLGLSISGMLVKSAGVPGDWDDTNVASIGLVSEPNVLDGGKIASFNGMDKGRIQELLGIRGFDFSFRVRAVDGTVLFDYGSTPAGGSQQKDVIIIRRVAIYESDIVFVEFGLWRE